MAIQVSTSWSCGSRGNKQDVSCVGVAGTHLASAYYYTGGGLTIRQNDDGTIDVMQTSLDVQQDSISNAESDGSWSADTWWFHGLYVSRTAFTLNDGPSGPSGHGEGVKVWSDGKISHDGYPGGNPSSHYSWLSSGSSTGWQRIASNIEQIEHSSDGSELYLYAGGLIDYSGSADQVISIPSVRITLRAITGGGSIQSFFKYYPWERRISGTWYSLNRNGGTSTSAGLFRMVSGSWRPCTNTSGSSVTSDDHGFRYNSGWKKSPKSGQGA